jgi:hypothetical protein
MGMIDETRKLAQEAQAIIESIPNVNLTIGESRRKGEAVGKLDLVIFRLNTIEKLLREGQDLLRGGMRP